MHHCTYSALPFLLAFFFNDTATTEIYTLSLHDALPISREGSYPADFVEKVQFECPEAFGRRQNSGYGDLSRINGRSEEHTSELQSLAYLVCRLLLEKKKYFKTSTNVDCYPHNTHQECHV